MANWRTTVKVKHLFTEEEDYESIAKSMNAVADVLAKEVLFNRFDLKPFRSIPTGDDFFAPIDYANKLLDRMYDYADENLIWIA